MTVFLILLGSPSEQTTATAVLSYIAISFWPLGRNSNTHDAYIIFLMLRIPGQGRIQKIFEGSYFGGEAACLRGVWGHAPRKFLDIWML